MRERLLTLEEAKTPIRVAIIGCGRFGSMMIAQIMRPVVFHGLPIQERRQLQQALDAGAAVESPASPTPSAANRVRQLRVKR